jgi:hypothetical protein
MIPEKAAELRVKHLEFVQAVVARMAGYSAQCKSACLALVTAIAGFAISLQRPVVLLAALIPIALFALLDGHYLLLERRFRALYDSVRSEDWVVPPTFSMDVSAVQAGSLRRVVCTWSISTFYVSILAGVVIAAAGATVSYGRFV